MPTAEAMSRLAAKCHPSADGCWVHRRADERGGYASITYEKRQYSAHRASYEYFRAPIPDGLTIDHLCGRTSCVNPWHMEPVPNAVNNSRSRSPSAINAAKTHCLRGHEFTPENTYRPRGKNSRACYPCMLDRTRGYRAAKRAKYVTSSFTPWPTPGQ